MLRTGRSAGRGERPTARTRWSWTGDRMEPAVAWLALNSGRIGGRGITQCGDGRGWDRHHGPEAPSVGSTPLGSPARRRPPGCTEPMAPSVKSYSELQREHISAELGQREVASRKAAQAAWHSTRDDL